MDEEQETLLGTADAQEKEVENNATQNVDAQESENQKGDDALKKNAPEQYEYTFEDAEQMDESVRDTFSDLARELDISNDQANKVLGALAQKVNQRQQERVDEVKAQWAQSAKEDKEFGGEAFNENIAVAKKAMDKFASSALVQYMNESGLGNHPEIIRLFYKVGKSVSEDRFVSGKEPTEARSAQSIYDKSNMNP